MHYKTLFVSDIHLGTRQCKVDELLKFIHNNTFDTVFLVGDIIDIYALQHKWYWHKDHNTFIQKILRMSRKGVKIVYVLGNHDEAIREFIKDDMKFSFGDIEVVNQYAYKTVLGKNMMIIHGDEFDGAFRSLGMLYWIGDRAYELALTVNRYYNWWRKLFGFKYWSLSAYLKSKVKAAMSSLNDFEELVTRKCIVSGSEMLVYGHTHTPGIKILKNKTIMNIGDHVENCTCIVETVEGDFMIIRTTDNTIIDRI